MGEVYQRSTRCCAVDHEQADFPRTLVRTMELIIDGSRIMSEDDFHDMFAKGLDLPGWYGRNLDALWDALPGLVKRPLKIVWLHADKAKERLPRYEEISSLIREVEAQDRQLKRSEVLILELSEDSRATSSLMRVVRRG